jgi:hypothetical protein
VRKGKRQGKGKEKEKEKRKGKRKGQGKGKSESTKALVILFLNHLGQGEKSVNYSVLYCTGRISSIVIK